jgi:ankyrin repeat protein
VAEAWAYCVAMVTKQKAKTKTKAKVTAKKPAAAKPAAKKPPKPPADPEEAMWKAIQKLDRAAIEAAVAAGASLSGNLSSIVYAESKLSPKDVARAKLLLDLGADPAWVDPEQGGNSILMQLAYAPNQDAALEVLDAMLAKQPKLSWGPANAGKQTPLHVAMWYGKSTKFWDKLVALGNPISPVDKSGNTPLLDAVSHDNTAGIEWLLAKGATLEGALTHAKEPRNYCSAKMIAWLAKRGAT